MNEKEQRQAEVLLRHWQAKKLVAQLRCQMSRAARTYKTLADALDSELEGGDDRRMARRVTGGSGFTVLRANEMSVGAPNKTFEPLGPDGLVKLATEYRAACDELESAKQEVAAL